MKTEYLLIGAGAALVLWLTTAGKKAAAAVAGAVNPLNPDNLANTFTNSVGGVLTGDPNFALGVSAYDLVHGDTSSDALKYWSSQPAGSKAKSTTTTKPVVKGAKPPATNKGGTSSGINIDAIRGMQGPTTGTGWTLPAKDYEPLPAPFLL